MRRHMVKKGLVLVTGMALLLIFQGCASKSYVAEQIAPLDKRVADLDNRVGAMDGQSSDMAAKLSDHDRRITSLRLERQIVGDLKEGVNFSVGSTVLSAESRENIDEFLGQFEGMEDVHYILIGFADQTGKARANFELGIRRAIGASKHMIVNLGIDAKRVNIRSEGAAGSMGAEPMDRRVEIIAYKEIITEGS